ncbi:MAG: hypothetical protein HY784_09915 [Chloroflexi bacterium]|nr:hypothetical protein [Chloroflexota bacterium]
MLEPLKLPEGFEVKLILLEAFRLPGGATADHRKPVVTVPAGAFRRLMGLISVGGDALAESESLYDDESRN